MLSVFVYGTLKPGGRYYERYCGFYSPTITPALTRGKLFDFPHLGYPAMTSGDGWVKGYLYRFSTPRSPDDASSEFLSSQILSSQILSSQILSSQILSQLDSLEGYHPNKTPENNEYERFEADTFDTCHQFLQRAWVYRMPVAAAIASGGLPVENGEWPMS